MNNFKSPSIIWETIHNVNTNFLNENVDFILDYYKPSMLIDSKNINYFNQLFEATYKEIALKFDPNFLKQKIRVDQLGGVEYKGFQGDTMIFLVPSFNFDKNGKKYVQRIRFEQWEDVGTDQSMNFVQKAQFLLKNTNIKIDSDDPSFLYWGYQYILTKMDAAINPETRTPNVRNPNLRGAANKHMVKTIGVLPFYRQDIAGELKRQFGTR